MPRLPQTITAKFTAVLLVFLVLQAAQLATGIYGVLSAGEDSTFVNEAGRQRMYTLLLADLARSALAAGPEQDAAWARLRGAIGRHADAWADLQRLVSEKHKHAQLSVPLDEAYRAWQRDLRPLLDALDARQPHTAEAALDRYQSLAFGQVERLDRVVGLLERHIRDEARWSAMMHGIVIALTLALAAVAVVIVRRSVTAPLRQYSEAAMAMGAGAYDQRVPVTTRDEIGALGEVLNNMAEVAGQKAARIAALYDAVSTLSGSLSASEIVNEIMRRAMGLTGARAACIAFCDQRGRRFVERHARGLPADLAGDMALGPGGPAHRALRAGAPVQSSDRYAGEIPLSQAARREAVSAIICLPLAGEPRMRAVLCLYSSGRDAFPPDEVDWLTTFVHIASGAVRNARVHEQTLDLASTDDLTGLKNRRVLEENLVREGQRALRYRQPLSLIMLDIDDFKAVNDTYGHATGDAVLKSVARVMTSQMRDADTVARYGGEEFVLLLPETNAAGARPLGERLRAGIAAAGVELDNGQQIKVTVSVGVASFPDCATEPDLLVRRADQALYTAKRSGKNQVVVYGEMLKAQLENAPDKITELLMEGEANIQPIVTAVSAKAPFFRSHTEVVDHVAARIGRAVGLPERDMQTLHVASLLHDVGMITIPDAVLNKRDHLAPQERAMIKQHAASSADLLEPVPWLRDVVPVVRHHHERFDGGGYPDGLKGTAIPYLARILAVADTYAAIVADWPGYTARGRDEARAVLAEGAGTQFDPDVVAAFLDLPREPEKAWA